jgi:hypothetical protein
MMTTNKLDKREIVRPSLAMKGIVQTTNTKIGNYRRLPVYWRLLDPPPHFLQGNGVK